MQSHLRKQSTSILIILVLLGITASPAYASPSVFQAGQQNAEVVIESALGYLKTQMNDDGGIRWMDDSSSMAVTLRVVMALSANHFSQDFLKSDSGLRPVDYLVENGDDWVNQVGSEQPGFNLARAGQLLTAVAAANLDPRHFGPDDSDLIYQINLYFDPGTGIFGQATSDNVMDQVWAIIGLSAANVDIPEEAARWLANVQGEDGSWNDGYGSYLDTTPYAMLALLASGNYSSDSPEILSAIAFMQNEQNSDGGWQTQWDTITNASTTSAMLQTIAAMNDLPMGANWQQEGGNPYTTLSALQQDNGMIGGDYANAYSTADALIGLSGRPVFNLGTLVKVNQAFDFLFNIQTNTGGWDDLQQTSDAILAIFTAGWDPTSVMADGHNPVVALGALVASDISDSPEVIAKTIQAAHVSNLDPQNINGVDLVDTLNSTFNSDTSMFGGPGSTVDQAYGILGLAAAGHELPNGVNASLIALQNVDGGWPTSAGGDSSALPTALAIQALMALGETPDSTEIQSALSYLVNSQFPDGGWGDSLSTAEVIMALNILGQTPDTWITEQGHTPITALIQYQNAKGAFVLDWRTAAADFSATTAALRSLFSGSELLGSDNPITNVAGLVIDSGDAEPQNACIPIAGEPISGLDMLDASGMPYDADEGFINSINEISNPEGETNYWSYWHWDGKAWVFNNTGINDSDVLPGTIEAWHFTSWERFPSLPPDVAPSLSDICNEPVLKNYTVTPFIDYSDLFKAKAVQDYQTVTESTASQGDTPTSEPEGIATEMPTEAAQDQAPVRSVLPIIIIGVVALVVLIVIVSIVTKRRNES